MLGQKQTKNLLIGLLSLIGTWGLMVNGLAVEPNIKISTFRSPDREGNLTRLPGDWEVKVWQGTPEVELVRETRGTVLKLRSHESCIALYKEIQIDLSQYPSFSWEWKVTEWPKQGDARIGSRDDQAAGIYVVFPKFPAFLNSRIIGYVWESDVPEGTILKSQNDPRVHYVVMRSGKREAGNWVREVRNVRRDYEQIFGEQPPKVGGVSLVIDSDHTQSSSESYFGDIYFSSSPYTRDRESLG